MALEVSTGKPPIHTLLNGDAHVHRSFIKYKVFGFVGQLLEHPVWGHLQLPVDYFCQFSGKFEKPCSLISPSLNLRGDIVV